MEMIEFQVFCRLSLGEAQLLAGRLEEAHALAERALAQAREHQERGNEAYALHLLGDIAARCEPPESERAEAYYRQALKLDPQYVSAHINLTLTLGEQGKRDEATASGRRAVEIDPNHALAHVSLGTALQAQEKFAEAEAPLRDCLAIYMKKQPKSVLRFGTESLPGAALAGSTASAWTPGSRHCCGRR